MLALRAHSTSTTPILEDVPNPELGPQHVRIRVSAAAINPVDVGIVAGPVRAAADLPDPIGLGWDVSGTVIEVGDQITDLVPGARVAGMLNVIARRPQVGTHAETTVLPRSALAVVPEGVDMLEAAALPLTALAAHQAVELLGPGEGRALLVTGGAGALGGHALTLAQRAGWRVTALARAADEQFVIGQGATLTTTIAKAAYDAVLDAAVLGQPAVAGVRDHGVAIGVAPAAPLSPERSVTVLALFVQEDGDQLTRLLRLTAQGILMARVAGRVPLAEASTAYRKAAAGGHRGRWLLLP